MSVDRVYKMISFREALNIVLSEAVRMRHEKVDYRDSVGRILAEDVISDMDMPPFDKSAMDGYACRREDLGKDLKIIETVSAGTFPELSIGEGECSRIMTGARVPDGADVVIKVEETEMQGREQVRFTGKDTKANISLQGEDIRTGDRVLLSGTLIEPRHMAVLASVGWVHPVVSDRPRVAVLSTGDEIVEPHVRPGPSQIRNSNGQQLVAQVRRAGAVADYIGIASDDEEITYRMLSDALENNDVVLMSGGVSMGQFDFIPAVLERLKIEILFKTVALQPGKPTVFGKTGNKRIFGLPGNPVSSFNIFELFVRPMLYKSMGMNKPVNERKIVMGAHFSRKRSQRMSWIPVAISEDYKAIPVEYHGSAHIFSLVQADAFIAVPVGITKLKPGDYVDVRPL